MATFIYDGKSNLTAAQTDTVVITADPTLFTQATQNVNDAVLRFGSNTLTITGATLTTDATVATSLKNVSIAGGNFTVGVSAVNSTTTNSLYIGTDAGAAGNTYQATGASADSKNALFGGNGVSGPNDLADTLTIGGKGSFLVYGNGGNDTISQNATAFDSTSAVTIFGGKGADGITLQGNANNKGSLLVLGGEDGDTIKVTNAGTTTIFGGTGAGDSADGADSIGLTGSGGTITVYGNGGDDFINGDAANNLTNGTAFLDGTKATLFGGTGNDTINVSFAAQAKGTVTIYGGENNDTIKVVNAGTTTIYGGTGQGDSTDGADNIILTGSSGTVTVFGNAGDDFVTGTVNTNAVANFADGVNATIYGGKGNDTINLGIASGKGTINVFGGEDQDSISVAVTAGSATTVYGGTGQGDTTDSADLITITGQGTATVFGNGGNDSINVAGFTGASNAASANVVTVYGGTGNDSINVGSTLNGQVTYNLSGNEGSDTFIIGNVGATEVASVTFANVAATKALTVAGLTITAGNANAVTISEITTAIAGKADGSSINVTTASGGTISGTLSGYSTGAAGGANNDTIAFTSSQSETNVQDLTVGGSATGSSVSAISQGITSASSGTGVSILDFTAGSDKLSIQNGVAGTSTPTLTAVPANGFADLQSALNAASANATKGSVGVVAFGGSTYVVTNNDGSAGFTASADSAIKLTGVTDINAVANAITVL